MATHDKKMSKERMPTRQKIQRSQAHSLNGPSNGELRKIYTLKTLRIM